MGIIKRYCYFIPLLVLLSLAAPFFESMLQVQFADGSEGQEYITASGFDAIIQAFTRGGTATAISLLVILLLLIQISSWLVRRENLVMYTAIALFTLFFMPVVPDLLNAISWQSLIPLQQLCWGYALFTILQAVLFLVVGTKTTNS